MAQRAARQSMSRAGALDATRSSMQPVEEEKSCSSEWQHDVSHGMLSQGLTRVIAGARELGVVDEKKHSAINTISAVFYHDEIEQLQRYHENSYASSTRRAYQSDRDSFVHFLRERFPRLSIDHMQQQCTLEHVLAYLIDLCNEGKKISTALARPARTPAEARVG
jgi:hypothetical protein